MIVLCLFAIPFCTILACLVCQSDKSPRPTSSERAEILRQGREWGHR